MNKKVKVFVVYDTKHGNTKLVAKTILEGMGEVEGIETAISDVEEVDLERVAGYDAILMGSPNHWGGPVRGINKLIDNARLVYICEYFFYHKGVIDCDIILYFPSNVKPDNNLVQERVIFFF